MKYILLLSLLCGCSSVSGYEPDETTIKALVSSQIAFHEPQPADKKPDIQTTCTKCEGKKIVESGDKLSWVACPCGENCKCKKPSTVAVGSEPKAENRMLLFTALWCPPCREWMDNNATELKRQGWDISEGPDAHIQLIDSDTQPKIFFQYKIASMPTFVMINPQGEELARFAGGGMDAVQTAEFFYDNQPLPRSSYPEPVEVPQREQEVQQDQQTFYYETYEPTRRGRRFSSGCSSGRCR